MVYVVGGSCLLFKREAVEKAGLFVERTLLGREEFIISEKLTQHGYQVRYAPASVVYHKVGQATKKHDSAQKMLYFAASERYFQDHYAKFPCWQLLMSR